MARVSQRLRLAVFLVAVSAYLLAVTQRTSLGIAGVMAAERFEASSTALSLLGVMQIVVYAALQIPVGVLLDRFGSARLIAVGATLMVLGQTLVAFAPDLGLAILGRMLVGAGDATTFVSGLRIIANWYEPRRVPLLTQWYGTIGQFGQLLSAIPFAVVLGAAGWVPGFLSLAGLGVLVLVAILLFLHDSPQQRRLGRRVSFRQAFGQVGEAWRQPGTRLGFWTHFTTQFSMTMFTLMWGVPYLVGALGYAPATASFLLSLVVASGMVAGPVFGVLTARYPFRRSNIVLTICGASTVTWLALVLWPGQPPFALVVWLVVLLGMCGVGSAVGFDFARTSNPVHRYGSASGVVNVGGFLASFTSMFVMGLVLDWVSGDAVPGVDAFRGAFLVPVVVLLGGMTAMLLARHRARTRLQAEEGIVVGPLWIALTRRWNGGRSRPADEDSVS